MTAGANISAVGTLTVGGNATFSGTALFANNVTIKKSPSSTTPLTIATSYSSGDNSNRAAIKFERNDGTAIGYIGCRIVNNVKEPYFNGGSYHTIWQAGNANLSSVDWACKDLVASGNVVASGGVAAGGIADLTIY